MSSTSHRTHCRVCGESLSVVFADLGMVPLCQSYPPRSAVFDSERFFPLRPTACMRCHYVGLPEYVPPQEIFTEYAYFSSTSSSWLDYTRAGAEALRREFRLAEASLVVEMGSNDGYLLKHFAGAGIQVVGVEPAANVAQVANANGVRTLPLFFGSDVARRVRAEFGPADLVLSYNCLDHVPDLNDVVLGFRLLLKPGGTVQVELPYLASMVSHAEFDTIYHDRFSYLSLLALNNVFLRAGLRIIDASKIPTHGGSLRIRACLADDARAAAGSVDELLAEERSAGMAEAGYYENFMRKACEVKFALLEQLIALRRQGRSIVGYGVPAKGNVLLNFCGIGHDLIDFLVDRSPFKAGRLAPGTRIEIRAVEEIDRVRPDYLLILPWNIEAEIISQMSRIRQWGGRFIIPVPHPRIV